MCGQAEVYLPTPGPPFLCLIEHLYNLAQTLHIYILLQIYIGGMGFCSICEFILWKINKHTALTKTAPGVLKTNAQTFQQCLVAAEWISILKVNFLQHFLSNDMLSDSKSFQEHSCLKYWLPENENGKIWNKKSFRPLTTPNLSRASFICKLVETKKNPLAIH